MAVRNASSTNIGRLLLELPATYHTYKPFTMRLHHKYAIYHIVVSRRLHIMPATFSFQPASGRAEECHQCNAMEHHTSSEPRCLPLIVHLLISSCCFEFSTIISHISRSTTQDTTHSAIQYNTPPNLDTLDAPIPTRPARQHVITLLWFDASLSSTNCNVSGMIN